MQSRQEVWENNTAVDSQHLPEIIISNTYAQELIESQHGQQYITVNYYKMIQLSR